MSTGCEDIYQLVRWCAGKERKLFIEIADQGVKVFRLTGSQTRNREASEQGEGGHGLNT
jgi:hypothetical protein